MSAPGAAAIADRSGRRSSLSVIIPAYNSEATIAATLDSLAAQRFGDFEVVVVDSSPGDATARLIESRYADSRHPRISYHHSEERLLPHAARNRGAELSSGELLVFTDPDCVARPDWLEQLVAAHDRGSPVVGGAMEVEGGGWMAEGIHLSKFVAWLGGGPPGTRTDLVTANLLWTRSVFERIGGFRGEIYCGDTELCWDAAKEGVELRFEPRAVVGHVHTNDVRANCRERYVRGKDFAEMRMRVEGWTRRRAAAHLLLIPVVPLMLMARALGHARRAGRLRRALSTLPVQLAGHVCWGAGEGRAFARAARSG